MKNIELYYYILCLRWSIMQYLKTNNVVIIDGCIFRIIIFLIVFRNRSYNNETNTN